MSPTYCLEAETEALAAPAVRQHLIDPEICIRCNTCEETCPNQAISHNDDNYVVAFDACEGCGQCLDPCPTGAIRNWRITSKPYSLEAQLGWLNLPAETLPDVLATETGEPVISSQNLSFEAKSYLVRSPASASVPRVNLYRRDRPAKVKLVANTRVTHERSEIDVRHLVLDPESGPFPVLEGQSIGIVPPGFDAKGKRHAVRQYSVASCADGEYGDGHSMALTVKRVPDGLCSNQLCDLPLGSTIEVTGPFGATFLMPKDPSAHLLMICTGTGLAPFRGFIKQRQSLGQAATGQLHLFYGAQTPQAMPYFDWLQAIPASFLKQELCFSRQAGLPKVHVQDRLRSRADTVRSLLRDEKTHLFICGLKGMESAVEQAFRDILKNTDLSWDERAAYMKASGRYHVETY